MPRLICYICSKTLAHKSALNRHIATVHGEAQHEPYECHHCQKSFYNQNSMKRHVLSVHNNIKRNQRKEVACDKCNKTFFNVGSLNRHKKLHCGKPSLKKKTFKKKSNNYDVVEILDKFDANCKPLASVSQLTTPSDIHQNKRETRSSSSPSKKPISKSISRSYPLEIPMVQFFSKSTQTGNDYNLESLYRKKTLPPLYKLKTDISKQSLEKSVQCNLDSESIITEKYEGQGNSKRSEFRNRRIFESDSSDEEY